LQLLCCSPERQALKDGEPQGSGLSCRQLIYKLLQRQIISGPGCFLLWAGQLIEQARLASGVAIKADVTQGALTLLMQPARHAHQPHPIAQVVLQGPCDAAAQIGRRRLASSAAGSGADQGFTGHLDQILPLHQREEAPGGGGSQGIGEREVLQHQGIAGTQGRTAERRGLLLAAGGGSGGSHLRDGREPHPQRPAAAPRQGRPTPEGAWPDP
jgi:hypothetical protein